MKSALRTALKIALVLLVLWLVIPTTDIVSPDWDVFVNDMNGQPIEAASVYDNSQQYTLESTETSVSKVTDHEGHVHFDERTIRANGFTRLLGVFRNLGQGPHASFGVHTWLFADKPGYGDPAKLAIFARNEREGSPNGQHHQIAQLTLQKCPPGYSGIGCAFSEDRSQPTLPLHQNDDLH